MGISQGSSKDKLQVLAFINIYLPGFKGGGPARSLSNIAESLGALVKFKIFTADRDKGDRNPYSKIKINAWNPLGDSDVFYSSDGFCLKQNIWRILRKTSFDVVYFNSFFHSSFSILPLCLLQWFLRLDTTIILAPRGEFSPGALSIKRNRKKAYIFFAKLLGITRGVIWHASSTYEAADIRRELGEGVVIRIATNIPDISTNCTKHLRRHEGALKIIFLSRISPKKNLLGALSILGKIDQNIEFNVYGPVDDPVYWGKCCKKMDQLPPNIRARYLGAITPVSVSSVFAQHDLFLFPTKGENYGHVIVEALAAGCAVLTSDQTPWGDLEESEVGWSIPLSEQHRFVGIIEWMATRDDDILDQFSERARIYANAHAGSNEVIESNLALFQGIRS